MISACLRLYRNTTSNFVQSYKYRIWRIRQEFSELSIAERIPTRKLLNPLPKTVACAVPSEVPSPARAPNSTTTTVLGMLLTKCDILWESNT